MDAQSVPIEGGQADYATQTAMMPPLPNLSKKQATRRNDKEDATPKIVVDPLPKEGVI